MTRGLRGALIAYHSSPLTEPGSGDAGGMTVYIRSLADALLKRDIRTDIFTRAADDVPQVTHLAPGIRVVSIEAGPRSDIEKEQRIQYLDRFIEGVRSFGASEQIAYDFVHSHYWQSGVAGMTLAEGWEVPLIHSNHTLARVKNGYLAPGDRPEPALRIRAESSVIDSADALIASSEEEWRHLSCLYGASHDRIQTIQPGVDHRVFCPGDATEARHELGLGDEAVLLAVGRIQPLKGMELALRAVEQLVPVLDREVVLIVVGGPSGRDGDLELARLRTLASELGIADNVRFVGTRRHDDLPIFYRAADALVICSHTESFGLTALEAHACGTPVVATSVGGLREVVVDDRSGFLVEERDATEFATRLKTLLSDGALRTEFSSAAVDAAAGFSWDSAADQFADLYECLVEVGVSEACICY
ncbi:MAG: D-inositol-3-phosphate glycosyltransferase [Actinomycetota bacterium]|nr:D-inositol-3-phosphate glycosyltransferase [Actinomycetota bacterium]